MTVFIKSVLISIIKGHCSKLDCCSVLAVVLIQQTLTTDDVPGTTGGLGHRAAKPRCPQARGQQRASARGPGLPETLSLHGLGFRQRKGGGWRGQHGGGPVVGEGAQRPPAGRGRAAGTPRRPADDARRGVLGRAGLRFRAVRAVLLPCGNSVFYVTS